MCYKEEDKGHNICASTRTLREKLLIEKYAWRSGYKHKFTIVKSTVLEG